MAYVDPAAPVKVPKFSRRAALAEAATRDNPLLARAFVNHTWAILMGRGIVHPADEMNSKHPPSHPELLDWLAHGFRRARLRHAPRWCAAIVLSRGYQLAAGGDRCAAAGGLRRRARNDRSPPRRSPALRASQRACRRTTTALRRAFAERFPDVLPRVTRATIQQAMFLANSEQLAALFKPASGNAAGTTRPVCRRSRTASARRFRSR